MVETVMTVGAECAGLRLDLFLARHVDCAGSLESPSRAEVQRLIREGQVRLNGRLAKASARLKPHDNIRLVRLPPRDSPLIPEKIPLDILYEDEHCIVINKMAGIMVHPAAGNLSGTLVNALLHHCPELGAIGGERRPGIVHRLDKDTSGVMIIAKTAAAFHRLARQFKERQVQKTYVAFVWGKVPGESGIINRSIGRHRADRKRMSSRCSTAQSRAAVTRWQVARRFKIETGLSAGVWVSCLTLKPKTGRTHQLRVHLADLGFPIIGDKIYGRRRVGRARKRVSNSPVDTFPRQALHAQKLGFIHPASNRVLELSAPWPRDMRDLLGFLEQNSSRDVMP